MAKYQHTIVCTKKDIKKMMQELPKWAKVDNMDETIEIELIGKRGFFSETLDKPKRTGKEEYMCGKNSIEVKYLKGKVQIQY